MHYKAVAFDLDGTLVCEPSSWYTLHKYFGTYEQSKKNMASYESGEIDYQEFMRRDIGLWQPAPHIDVLTRILFKYTPTRNSETTLKNLTKRGYKLFVVTTAPDFFANHVSSKLGIDKVACNGLIFDNNKCVTQDTKFRVDLMKKEKAFESLLSESGVDCKDCIAVGDSKYDKGFLARSGLGVAFNPAPDCILRKEANYVIDDMNELLKLI
jgi:phosphoserine phosphatase